MYDLIGFFCFMVVVCFCTATLVAFVWWILYVFGAVTKVNESTAMFIVRGGSRRKTLFSKRGFKLDDDDNLLLGPTGLGPNGELVPDPNILPPLLGGWRWVGIPWLDTVYTYDWTWVKIRPNDQGEYVLKKMEEKGTNFILVGQVYVYGLEIRGKDVVDKDLVPVEASLALAAMIVNPRKALFDTRDWFNTFISLVDPGARNYINCNSYRDIIAKSEKDLGKDVFKALQDSGVVNKLEKVYGIKLLAVECKGIRLEGEYQKSQTEKWQAERDAERDRAKRLGSTTSTLIAMIAEWTGTDVKKIQREFKGDSANALKKYAGLIEMNKDFIVRLMGLDAGAMRQYYFNGAQGGMDLIALLGDVFRSRGMHKMRYIGNTPKLAKSAKIREKCLTYSSQCNNYLYTRAS